MNEAVIIQTERFAFILDPNDFYFISTHNDTGSKSTEYETKYYIEMFSKYSERELLIDFGTNKQNRDESFAKLINGKGALK